MRKSLILVFALIVFGFCTPVSAQNNTEPFEKGVFFTSLEACQAAYAAGPEFFRFYQPLPKHLKTPPVSAKGLSVNGCAQESVRRNESKIKNPWVINSAGILVVYNKDGNPVMDGRCWNKIHRFVPLPLPKGNKGEPGKPGLRGPRGYRGQPGRDAIVLLPVNHGPSPLKWGISGGISMGQYSGPIADRDICEIKSTTANLGLAYGDPYRFFGRLTAIAVFINDGSSSSYLCTNCGTVTAVSNGMKVLGGNLEAVALVGPRSWKVQPTFYAEVGGGVVTGQADRYVTRNGSTSASRVDAEEFFGWKTMAHGGGGAGLTWHAGSNVSVEVLGKYRYPYGTSVGITITKWLGKK